MDVGAPSNFERLAALPEGAADVHVELVDDETIRAFATARRRTGIRRVFAHSSYLINAAAPDAEIRRKSWAGLADELAGLLFPEG